MLLMQAPFHFSPKQDLLAFREKHSIILSIANAERTTVHDKNSVAFKTFISCSKAFGIAKHYIDLASYATTKLKTDAFAIYF